MTDKVHFIHSYAMNSVKPEEDFNCFCFFFLHIILGFVAVFNEMTFKKIWRLVGFMAFWIIAFILNWHRVFQKIMGLTRKKLWKINRPKFYFKLMFYVLYQKLLMSETQFNFFFTYSILFDYFIFYIHFINFQVILDTSVR